MPFPSFLSTLGALALVASNAAFSTTPSVQAALWPKPTFECYGHSTVQVPTTFHFGLADDAHPILVDGTTRYSERILKSNFVSPVPADPSQNAVEDRSQADKLKLVLLTIQVEDQKDDVLGPDTDGKKITQKVGSLSVTYSRGTIIFLHLSVLTVVIFIPAESYRITIGQDDNPNTPFELDAATCAELIKKPIGPDFKSTLKAKTIVSPCYAALTYLRLKKK